MMKLIAFLLLIGIPVAWGLFIDFIFVKLKGRKNG
jgi:hypothetical protein